MQTVSLVPGDTVTLFLTIFVRNRVQRGLKRSIFIRSIITIISQMLKKLTNIRYFGQKYNFLRKNYKYTEVYTVMVVTQFCYPPKYKEFGGVVEIRRGDTWSGKFPCGNL